MPDNQNSIKAVPFDMEDFSPSEQPLAGGIEMFQWNEIETAKAGGIAPEQSPAPSDVNPVVFLGREFEEQKVFDETVEAVPEADAQESMEPSEADRQSMEPSEADRQREAMSAIIEQANAEAEAIREAARQDGYLQGYEKGLIEGKEEADARQKVEMQETLQTYLEDIKRVVEKVESEKDRILEENLNALRDLSIAVAEKVISVSLKSSGQIIEKMIAAATEQMKNRQWAKISISEHDADLMVQGDMDIIASLQIISDNIKVVVLEGADPGTCVIEFPDQIIDASVNTQLENIKELLS